MSKQVYPTGDSTIKSSQPGETVVGRRNVYANEPGMNATVEIFTEDPEEFLKRALAEGETVIEQFDVYFPTMMIPRWKLILLCISTLGLYLLVLLYRAFLRYMYKIRCLTPPFYELLRGKMAVTNKGRMIFWEQYVRQAKLKPPPCNWLFKICCRDLCAAPVKYTIFSNAKYMKMDSIRQVSQFYSSTPACFLCWCCCLDYECGVELSFGEFNHAGGLNGNYLMSTKNTMMSSVLQKFTQWTSRSFSAAAEKFGNVYGLTTKAHLMYIISTTRDKVRNGNIDETLEDVNELYARVIKCLPVQTMTEAFVPNSSIPNGKLSETSSFKGVTIVGSDMSVTVPASYFQLIPGESIINSVGLVYQLSCLDYLRVIWSMGWYYCSVLHHVKMTRAAIVITNKRVVVVDLIQRAGMIPSHLGSFAISVRCYITGNVTSGYINSSNFGHLESAITTDGGMLVLTFPRLPGADTRKKFMPFAKALQQSKRRANVKVASDVENQKPAARIGADLTDLAFVGGKEPLDTSDMDVLPFLESETIVDFIRGVPKWEPFCNLIYWLSGPEIAASMPPTNVCEPGKFCFPLLPYLFSCALRPRRKFDDVIFTSNSLIQYIRVKNEGICGFAGPIMKVEPNFWPCDGSSLICQSNASFLVAWTPADALDGHSVQYEYDGTEMWYSRLCMNSIIGRLCCPVNDASYSLVLHTGNFDFVTNGSKKNENWKENEAMQRAEKLVLKVEVMGR